MHAEMLGHSFDECKCSEIQTDDVCILSMIVEFLNPITSSLPVQV